MAIPWNQVAELIIQALTLNSYGSLRVFSHLYNASMISNFPGWLRKNFKNNETSTYNHVYSCWHIIKVQDILATIMPVHGPKKGLSFHWERCSKIEKRWVWSKTGRGQGKFDYLIFCSLPTPWRPLFHYRSIHLTAFK